MPTLEDTTTIQIGKDLNERLKSLAQKRSKKMGFSQTIGVRKYLELVVSEEEKRAKEDG